MTFCFMLRGQALSGCLAAIPVCVSRELYKENPRSPFDLDFANPVALAHYQLLCFFMSAFFDREQGSDKTNLFAANSTSKSLAQCVLMIEFLRSSPTGKQIPQMETFNQVFPKLMDGGSTINAQIREMGNTWLKENSEYRFDDANHVLEFFKDDVLSHHRPSPERKRLLQYYKERIETPESYYKVVDGENEESRQLACDIYKSFLEDHKSSISQKSIERLESLIERHKYVDTDFKAHDTRTPVPVADILDISNFSGVRFWFLINDPGLKDVEEVVWHAFAKNAKIVFERLAKDKHACALVRNNPKKFTDKRFLTSYMNEQQLAPKVFNRITLPQLCKENIQEYLDKCNSHLFPLLETHKLVMTPSDLAELLNVLLPYSQRIGVTPSFQHPTFTFKEYGFEFSQLIKVGQKFSNRNYVRVKSTNRATSYVQFEDCVSESIVCDLLEKTEIHLDCEKHVSVDVTQTMWDNYVPSGSVCFVPPMMTKDSYLLFSPTVCLNSVGRKEFPWTRTNHFHIACHTVRKCLDELKLLELRKDNPSQTTKRPKSKRRKINPLIMRGCHNVLIHKFLFADPVEPHNMGPDDTHIKTNQGVVEEIREALDTDIIQLKLLVSACSDMKISQSITSKLLDVYNHKALSVWNRAFRTDNPKFSPHNKALMQHRYKQNTLNEVPLSSTHKNLSSASNHHVRVDDNLHQLYGMYNQFAVAKTLANAPLDVLTLPEYDEKVFNSKLKINTSYLGKQGCGKSYCMNAVEQLLIENTVKRRDAETQQSFFYFSDNDCTREARFYNEPPREFSSAGRKGNNHDIEERIRNMLTILSDQEISKNSVVFDPLTKKHHGTSCKITSKINVVVCCNHLSSSKPLMDRFVVVLPDTRLQDFRTKSVMAASLKNDPSLIDSKKKFSDTKKSIQWCTSMAIQMLSTGVIPCDVNVSLADACHRRLNNHIKEIFPTHGERSRKEVVVRRRLWLRTVTDAVIRAFFSDKHMNILDSHLNVNPWDFGSIQKVLPHYLYSLEESVIQELCDSVSVHFPPMYTEVTRLIAQDLCGYRFDIPSIADMKPASELQVLRDECLNMIRKNLSPCVGFDVQTLSPVERKRLAEYLDSESVFHDPCSKPDTQQFLCHDKKYKSPIKEHIVSYKIIKAHDAYWDDPNYLCVKGKNRDSLIQTLLSVIPPDKKPYYGEVTLSHVIDALEDLTISFSPLKLKFNTQRSTTGSSDISAVFEGVYGCDIDDKGKVQRPVIHFAQKKHVTHMFLCVHYLTVGDPVNILSKWISSMRTPHTRDRHIVLGNQFFGVKGMPELSKLYRMTPCLVDIKQENNHQDTPEDLELKFAKKHYESFGLSLDILQEIHSKDQASVAENHFENYPHVCILKQLVDHVIDKKNRL